MALCGRQGCELQKGSAPLSWAHNIVRAPIRKFKFAFFVLWLDPSCERPHITDCINSSDLSSYGAHSTSLRCVHIIIFFN